MINKKLLQDIEAFDAKLVWNDEELLNNPDLLDKASVKLQQLALSVRTKKLMTEFGERDSDVYVVTFAKSGTTLMQMLLYQLTTDGNMDFKHLYDVSPWLRHNAYTRQPLPQIDTQRIIKTHDGYETMQHIQKGKFIVVLRDAADVIASFHQHIKDYDNPNANIADLWNRKLQDWFSYNMEWIDNKNGLPVLYINYEDLVGDKKNTILRIASFLEMDIDDATIERAIERTSIEFMKQHEDKFGEQPDNQKVYNNFIRKGKVGEGKTQFTAEQLAQYKNLAEKQSIVDTPMERYFIEKK